MNTGKHGLRPTDPTGKLKDASAHMYRESQAASNSTRTRGTRTRSAPDHYSQLLLLIVSRRMLLSRTK